MASTFIPKSLQKILLEEIRRSPVEVGRLSHYLQGFIHSRRLAGFLNQQAYQWSNTHRSFGTTASSRKNLHPQKLAAGYPKWWALEEVTPFKNGNFWSVTYLSSPEDLYQKTSSLFCRNQSPFQQRAKKPFLTLAKTQQPTTGIIILPT